MLKRPWRKSTCRNAQPLHERPRVVGPRADVRRDRRAQAAAEAVLGLLGTVRVLVQLVRVRGVPARGEKNGASWAKGDLSRAAPPAPRDALPLGYQTGQAAHASDAVAAAALRAR